MKKIFLAFVKLVLCSTALVSCNTGNSTQIPTTANTPFSTFTNTPQPTKVVPNPTLTSSHTPYPLKQVIFNYSISGWHTAFDSYLGWHWPIIVLYSDGQMIIARNQYQEKVLSPAEIDGFMSELEKLGFFSIETNQAHDPSNHLYDFEDQYNKTTGGTYYDVTVSGDRERSITVLDVWKEFLVPEMKNVLAFLDNYQPEGMKAYYPERILLHVITGRNPYDNTPDESIPWVENLPSLKSSGYKTTFIDVALDEKIMYFEGFEAKQIYDFLIENPSHVFIQNNTEYTVDMQIVLPHNEIFSP